MGPYTAAENGERRIAVLDALGLLTTPRNSHFDHFLAMASAYFGFERVAILLAGRTSLHFTARYGFADSAPPLSGSVTEVLITTGEPLDVLDAREDPRFANNAYVKPENGIRSIVGEPLHAPGGEVIGALLLASTQVRSLDPETRMHVKHFAAWIEDELTQENERRRATTVQHALSPAITNLPGYEIAGALTSARTVGGDFYDWHLGNEGIYLTVADVMGKGLGAALIASSVRAALRAAQSVSDFEAAVSTAARALDEDFQSTGSFATLFHGHLTASSGLLQYIDAGHGLSLLVRADGSYERLAELDLPLGANPDFHWGSHERVLQPGDSLVTFSDGVLDLFDGSFGSFDAVASLVHRSASIADAISILISMTDEDGAVDDVTILAVRRSTT